jgi:acetylornithine deacetylase/succinyl-diaminopimelate desuccinylase-like protein
MLDKVLERIDRDIEASLERLFALLRIESISTDPAYAASVRAAADWLTRELTGLGFAASTRPTGGHPIVVAHARPDRHRPSALFYGHYDVQPVDPLDLWETPPFEPRLMTAADGSRRIVGRGAADDKGQLMTFVEACRAGLAATGGLPLGVTLILEGEEECGSPNLASFLSANAEELRADIALVCDTNMWDAATPAITVMLRGLVGEEVIVTAASRDLHSGLFGGAARNPIHVLADILAGLHDKDGRIAVPGFYDGVVDPPAETRAEWRALDFHPDRFLGSVGLSVPAGERDRSVLEQIWSRPTAEVNGVLGGYVGAGFKTVIAARASAKVSFRLVAGQDPERIATAFRAYVRSHLPADCSVEFISRSASPAVSLPPDSAEVKAARAALAAEWGKPAAVIGSGGSIPVVGDLKKALGMGSLMVGYGLDDDRIHSPNEKYDLKSFHKGIRSWARILAALQEQQSK